MVEREIERRTFLKVVGSIGAVSLGTVLGVRHLNPDRQASKQGTVTGTRSPSGEPTPSPVTSTQTPANTAVETDSTATSTKSPDMVNLLDFGANVDGVTDNTEALRSAIRTVAADGTVVLPSGKIVISAKDRESKPGNTTNAAIRIDQADKGLTIKGQGPGPSGTHLVMGPNHSENHIGIEFPKESTESQKGENAGTTIRDLVLDGNWSMQGRREKQYPNAFGINVRGQYQALTLENCRVRNWATNGGLMRAPGVRLRSCTFEHNGYGAAHSGRHGHGFNVRTTDQSGRVVAEKCMFFDNTGEGIDARGGKVTVKDSIFDSNGWGIKIKQQTEDVLVQNCEMVNSGAMHIHCVPTGSDGTGRLRLESVAMNGSEWPAIDLNGRPGKIEGDNILVMNAARGDHRNNGAGIFADADSPKGDRIVDIGTLSVHNVVGSALHFEHASGSIDRLIYSDTDGIGSVDAVTIGTETVGDPISVSLPQRSAVGVQGS